MFDLRHVIALYSNQLIHQRVCLGNQWLADLTNVRNPTSEKKIERQPGMHWHGISMNVKSTQAWGMVCLP